MRSQEQAHRALRYHLGEAIDAAQDADMSDEQVGKIENLKKKLS